MRRHRHGPLHGLSTLAAALFFVVLLAPSSARAEPKEWILALQPGFALVHVGDRTAWGGGGGVDVSYGVSDSLAIRVTGAFTAHHLGEVRDPMSMKLTAPGGLVNAWHAGAGITYQVDILRLVPYFDLSFGLLGLSQPSDKGTVTSNGFGVEIGLGVDYILTRRISLGVVVRYHAYLTDIANIPAYLYAGPRVAFHFGN